MKVKVLKEFVDIHTNVLHQVDDVLDITDARLKEIQAVDTELVESVEETEQEAIEEPQKKGGRKRGTK